MSCELSLGNHLITSFFSLTLILAELEHARLGVLAQVLHLRGHLEALVLLIGHQLHREEPVVGEDGRQLRQRAARRGERHQQAQRPNRADRHLLKVGNGKIGSQTIVMRTRVEGNKS